MLFFVVTTNRYPYVILLNFVDIGRYQYLPEGSTAEWTNITTNDPTPNEGRFSSLNIEKIIQVSVNTIVYILECNKSKDKPISMNRL